MQRSYLGKVTRLSRPPAPKTPDSGASNHDSDPFPGVAGGTPLSQPSIDVRSLTSLWAQRTLTEASNRVSSDDQPFPSPVHFVREPVAAKMVQVRPTVALQYVSQSSLSRNPSTQVQNRTGDSRGLIPRRSHATQDIIQEILSNPPPNPPTRRKKRYKKGVSAGPPRSDSRGDLIIIDEDSEIVTWANPWNQQKPLRAPQCSRARAKQGQESSALGRQTVSKAEAAASRRCPAGPPAGEKTFRSVRGPVRSTLDWKGDARSQVAVAPRSVAASDRVTATQDMKSALSKVHALAQSAQSLPSRISTADRPPSSNRFHGPSVPLLAPEASLLTPKLSWSSLNPVMPESPRPQSGTSKILAAGTLYSTYPKPQPIKPLLLSTDSLVSEISTTSTTSTSSAVTRARRSQKLTEFEVMQFQAAVLTSCAARSLGPSLDDAWRERKNKMERMAQYAAVVRARMKQQSKVKPRG